MKILKIGGWTFLFELLALGVSSILGAGPCNATLPGLVMMALGFLAVPVGIIMILIGVAAGALKAR